jgi:hypothetical protein
MFSFLCPSQINEFVATNELAAVRPSVRDMPGIVLTTMQSDREFPLLKLRQSGIEFWNY